MTDQAYDIILYGASGFTGRQTVGYFAEHAAGGEVRWAIAGRNRKRLEAVKGVLAPHRADVGVIEADSADRAAVEAMVAQTRVLLTTAGPFSRYGGSLVDACVRQGVDYVDITGETPHVRRLIDTHQAEAAEKGVKIIPFCGFDSVPSDLGVLLVADHTRRELGQPCREVRSFFSSRGGVNGGTVASFFEILEADRMALFRDPILLNPPDRRSEEERARSRDPDGPYFEPDIQAWAAPFVMAPINTRVVRRSNALFAGWGEAYGPRFTYQEYMKVGRPLPRLQATAWAAGNRLVLGVGGRRGVRDVLRRVLPKPGAGPSEKMMDEGFFRCRLVGVAEDGRKVFATVSGTGDPGNRVTVRILCESALALALQREELPGGPGRGGILTPATGLGHVLAERLRRRGMRLEVDAACGT